MTTIGTKLFTLLNGEYVGSDEFGNRYYRKKRKKNDIQIGRVNTERRWVCYKGMAEPSKVPPYWHGWLHHTYDHVPTKTDMKRKFKWQKGHLPSLTGTEEAYKQPGLTGKSPDSSVDYEAWKPKN